MKPNVPKLIVAILAGAYFVWVAYDPMQSSFLDMVDLPIHETGHLIFSPLGQFIGVAGGSLFQIVLPAIFVGYFVWNQKPYSAAMVLFWVGQSIQNVFVYAKDAVVQQLVLTSGMTGSEGSFHDWNFLLTETGLIGQTTLVAGIIRFVSILTITAAFAGAIFYSFDTAEDKGLGDKE